MEMNKNAKWLSGLSLAAFAAAGLVYTGCTVTSGTVDDDGGIVRPDSGTSDATTEGGGGTDGGTDATTAACSQLKSPEVLGSAACNACLKDKCCTEMVGCLDVDVPDGGVACLDYDQCVRDCDKQDASTAQQCVTDICNLAASPAIQTGHTALIGCANTNCTQACQ
jgi:hypothetical protein